MVELELEMRLDQKWRAGIGLLLMGIIISFSFACGGGGGDNNTPSEASATIGPDGGTVEVTNPSSPLYGAKLEIPEGALEQETAIAIVDFSKSILEQQIKELPREMKFFGGIEIDAGDAVLKKPISISISNFFGATSNDQLLVGQVIDLDSKSPSEVIYKGVAHVGSPLTFSVSNFGSFGVLSPVTPLGIVSGIFVNQSGDSIPNGVIAASFSKPFVAQTDSEGYFEIPTGPPGSSPVVMAIPPSEVVSASQTPTKGIGMIAIELPPTFPTPSGSIIDLGIKLIMDKFNIPEPPLPPPCICDPPPPPPVFTSTEDHELPFDLSPGQTIRPFLSSLEGVYGGPLSPGAIYPGDLIIPFLSGSMGVTTEVIFRTENSDIASVDPDTGFLTAKSEGETTLHAEVWIIKIKNCGYIGIPCLYRLEAVPAKVKVGAQEPNVKGTNIIVHCHNPEGKEINSIINNREILDTNNRLLFLANIYDGDTLIGYGAFNAEEHFRPIPLSAGNHTIKVKYNGIVMEEAITLNKDETKELIFTFNRTEFDLVNAVASLGTTVLTGSYDVESGLTPSYYLHRYEFDNGSFYMHLSWAAGYVKGVFSASVTFAVDIETIRISAEAELPSEFSPGPYNVGYMHLNMWELLPYYNYPEKFYVRKPILELTPTPNFTYWVIQGNWVEYDGSNVRIWFERDNGVYDFNAGLLTPNPELVGKPGMNFVRTYEEWWKGEWWICAGIMRGVSEGLGLYERRFEYDVEKGESDNICSVTRMGKTGLTSNSKMSSVPYDLDGNAI